ncbi:hypothetical protein EJ110_NYTH39587 [Nymphaea thermarum]|nr:hypothetical protein EJ110_NYTH39587 [Nymphaea thermarum]
MGFASFFGRVLFSCIFVLSAWQMLNEFGTDGGPSVKQFEPKYNLFKGHVTKSLGIELPPIEIKHLVAAAIALKGVGGILFIFGSAFGAWLLLIYLALVTPLLHDFYNYDFEKPEFIPVFSEFVQNLALFGALLFFLGMKTSFPKKPKRKVVKAKTN